MGYYKEKGRRAYLKIQDNGVIGITQKYTAYDFDFFNNLNNLFEVIDEIEQDHACLNQYNVESLESNNFVIGYASEFFIYSGHIFSEKSGLYDTVSIRNHTSSRRESLYITVGEYCKWYNKNSI